METGSGERRRGSWWQTLPGMITAIAGLITAVTGLVVAIHQLWPSDGGGSQAAGGTAVTTAAGATTEAGGGAASETLYRVAFTSGSHAQIGDLRYDFLKASALSGNPGQVVLTLRVRLTNDGAYDANFWNNTFRLRVGADTNAPTNLLDDLVAGGATGTADIVFTLPGSARRATLLVGDDHSKAVALPLILRPH